MSGSVLKNIDPLGLDKVAASESTPGSVDEEANSDLMSVPDSTGTQEQTSSSETSGLAGNQSSMESDASMLDQEDKAFTRYENHQKQMSDIDKTIPKMSSLQQYAHDRTTPEFEENLQTLRDGSVAVAVVAGAGVFGGAEATAAAGTGVLVSVATDVADGRSPDFRKAAVAAGTAAALAVPGSGLVGRAAKAMKSKVAAAIGNVIAAAEGLVASAVADDAVGNTSSPEVKRAAAGAVAATAGTSHPSFIGEAVSVVLQVAVPFAIGSDEETER